MPEISGSRDEDISSPAPASLERTDRRPTFIAGHKTDPRAYSTQHSKSVYGKEHHAAKQPQAVSVNTIDKPYKNKSAFLCKFEYPPDIPGLTELTPENMLLVDAVEHQIYHLIRNTVRNKDDVASKLNNMTKKAAVQMKHRTFNGKNHRRWTPSCQTSRRRAMPAPSRMGGHISTQTLLKWISWILLQCACHLTNQDRQGTRTVSNVVFRYRQIYSQARRLGRQRCNRWRQHPNRKIDGDGLHMTTIDQGASIPIRLCGEHTKGLFVESMKKLIFHTLRQWRSKHQSVLLNSPEQKEESFPDFQGHKPRPGDQLSLEELNAIKSRGQEGDTNPLVKKLWTSNNRHRRPLVESWTA